MHSHQRTNKEMSDIHTSPSLLPRSPPHTPHTYPVTPGRTRCARPKAASTATATGAAPTAPRAARCACAATCADPSLSLSLSLSRPSLAPLSLVSTVSRRAPLTHTLPPPPLRSHTRSHTPAHTHPRTQDDVATSTKRNYLLNTILPRAVAYYTQHLRVVPVSGALKITPNCRWSIGGSPCCETHPSQVRVGERECVA